MFGVSVTATAERDSVTTMGPLLATGPVEVARLA